MLTLGPLLPTAALYDGLTWTTTQVSTHCRCAAASYPACYVRTPSRTEDYAVPSDIYEPSACPSRLQAAGASIALSVHPRPGYDARHSVAVNDLTDVYGEVPAGAIWHELADAMECARRRLASEALAFPRPSPRPDSTSSRRTRSSLPYRTVPSSRSSLAQRSRPCSGTSPSASTSRCVQLTAPCISRRHPAAELFSCSMHNAHDMFAAALCSCMRHCHFAGVITRCRPEPRACVRDPRMHTVRKNVSHDLRGTCACAARTLGEA